VARYLVTFTQAVTVEADSKQEAQGVAEERVYDWPAVAEVSVEIIEGVTP
jgi:hypothetical protein